MKTTMMVLVGIAVVMFNGCGSDLAETGFISDYSKLEKESESVLRYVDTSASTYSDFIIDPVQTRFTPTSKAEDELDPQTIKDLTNYMHTKLIEAVKGAGLNVVHQPGSGVARIRAALTHIEKSDAISMVPQASLMGVGIGGASMEMEVVDSITRKQIGASIQSQEGTRIPFANLGDWTAAKSVIDGWTKRFQKTLEEIHEK
jgi:hypothetical protein